MEVGRKRELLIACKQQINGDKGHVAKNQQGFNTSFRLKSIQRLQKNFEFHLRILVHICDKNCLLMFFF